MKVIGVRFRDAGKVYYFSPGKYDIKSGQHVIVETARGIEYGYVVLGCREMEDDKVVQPLKTVVRMKIMGGIGICGRPLCCHSYLSEFIPVSIRMAKEQNLSLNPTKISGVCGRLMCCLKNEEETYEYLNSTLPGNGDFVTTDDGLKGEVHSVNVLRQTVKVIVTVDKDEKEIREYKAEQLKFKPRRRREKQKGQSPELKQLEELERADRTEKAERPQRGEHFERGDKPERGNRTERSGRSERGERPGKARGERLERPEGREGKRGDK